MTHRMSRGYSLQTRESSGGQVSPRPSPARGARTGGTALFGLILLTLFAVGRGSAAEPGLPDGGGSAPKAAAPQASVLLATPSQPTTPILDDFNRPNENPLSQGGAWAPRNPRGAGAVLAVISNQAGTSSNPSGANASYRTQGYSGDFEAYVTLTVKPPDGNSFFIVFDILQEGSDNWDGYYLRVGTLSGPDDFSIRRLRNNTLEQIDASAPVEFAAGDKIMVRRVGPQIEGWVYQAASGTWSRPLVAIDGTFLGGKIGIGVNETTTRLDDFGGGAFALPPPPPEQSIGTCGIGVHAYSRSACRLGVNTLTGAYTTHVADLELPGIGVPFLWRRSYTSSDSLIGALGCGWTSSYEVRLADANPPPLLRRTAAAQALGSGDLVLRGEDGQQLLYTRQADGSYVGAPGTLSTLSAINGGVDGYELTRHDQVEYRFDADGRLTSIKDRNNQGLTLAYDPSNPAQLQTITDSVGRQVAVLYDSGRISRVTLPDGRYVEYGYTDGRLSSVRDARGGFTQYTYEGVCRLKTTVDQDQHTQVRLDYDQTSERVTDEYNALDEHSIFAWDPATLTATLTDPRQNQWQDRYSSNALVERVNPLSQRVGFAYDGDLNVIKVTDGRGNATTMTYDLRGDLLTRIAPAPLSYQEVWTYTARNDPLSYRDGRGNTTDYGYDAAGNLTSVTGPDADGPGPLGRPQTLYGRDPGGTGVLTSITDARGKQTSFTYTSGNLTQIQTSLGNKTTMGYDGAGRMTSLVDPRGNAAGANPADYTWTYTYNEENQLETQTDPLGNVTDPEYDPAGRLVSREDANQHVTSYGYDDANRLTTLTAPDPDGGGPLSAPVTQYAYDADGNLETRTDSNQHQTSYEYDAANRLTRVTAPGNRVWTYAYDGNGNVTQVVDANGNATPTTGDGQTTYGYDVLNRPTSIDYSDTTPDVTFAYDANGNRTQMTDGSGSESYVYDSLNRLTSVTRGADVFSYAYDLVNLIQATYPSQPTVAYAFDDDERFQSAGPSGQTTSYTYDEAGNLKQTTLPAGNGYLETRTYDRAGRLTDVKSAKSGTTLSEFAITPDPVGNPLSVVRTGSLAQTQTYGYDNMDRLTSICFQANTCPGGSDPFIRWTYDRVGNRLTEARPSGTTNYGYNVADELQQAGSTSYTYDQNGNELSAGSRTFNYDLANRVKTTTSGNTTTTYSYDGDGKRLQASTGTQASKKTNFLWDVNRGLPQLALERDGNNALIRRYTYGQRRLSQTAGSNTSYFIYDGLGSVANLTSATSATQWTWSYEPFGATRTEQKASGNQPDNFMKFAGEYLDPTGLYHLRARQYDAGTGRFLARDPVADSITAPYVSSYAYGGDTPTVYTDPTGELNLLKDLRCPLCGEASELIQRGKAGAQWLGSEAWQHKGAIVLTAALAVGATACVLATAPTAGTVCAAVLLGGGIGGLTGGFTAASQGVTGDDLLLAIGSNALIGEALGRFGGTRWARAAIVGGGLTATGNVTAQSLTVGLNDVNRCAVAAAGITGAIGAGKGTYIASNVAYLGRASETLAGSIGGILPSAALDPLSAGLGC